MRGDRGLMSGGEGKVVVVGEVLTAMGCIVSAIYMSYERMKAGRLRESRSAIPNISIFGVLGAIKCYGRALGHEHCRCYERAINNMLFISGDKRVSDV